MEEADDTVADPVGFVAIQALLQMMQSHDELPCVNSIHHYCHRIAFDVADAQSEKVPCPIPYFAAVVALDLDAHVDSLL